MRVVPALLSADQTDYRRKLELVASFTDFVQIDFMDGVFVPSRSVSAEAAGAVKVPLAWEAHLMVIDPLAWMPALAGPLLRRVIFHREAVQDPVEVAARLREMGYEASLALNPETDVPRVLGILPSFDAVLVMSVNPGFYGSPFIPGVLEKIRAVKRALPGMTVGLDGGVGPDNLAAIKEAGADYACIGSRIFQAADPAASFARLAELAR